MSVTNKPPTVASFFREHLWQILVILFVSSVSFVILREEVKTLTQRVQAVEIHQAEYPSEDWFVLKFSTIDKKLETLEKKIDDSIK